MIKKLILMFWLLCIVAAFGLISDPAGLVLKVLAVMILLAHCIELIVFEKAIKSKAIASGDSTAKSLFMTLLYGLFYFKF